MIRKANFKDLEKIISLEKKYYDGYSIAKDLLLRWIKNENYYVIDKNSKVLGSIYFEFINEIKDLPWYHEPIIGLGEYIYISEIAVESNEMISFLFNEVIKACKENNCKGVVWLTGVKSNHDKIEQKFLKSNGFKMHKRVEKWEYVPGYFINDHSLRLKVI